jgi:hypothetical protein
MLRLMSAAAIAVALGACGAGAGSLTLAPSPSATNTATPVPPTATPAPQAQVIAIYSKPVAVAGGQTGSVTASCPSGTVLVSGGFISQLNSGGTQGWVAQESYPVSTTKWKVSVANLSTDLHLTAIAVCLKASFAASMQIVKSTASMSTNDGTLTKVACPQGSVLTGGGFQAADGLSASSQPSGNGWQTLTGRLFNGTPTVYAICATQGLRAGSIHQATKTLGPHSTGSNSGGCAKGQLPVGGGYNGYGASADTVWNVFINRPNADNGAVSTGWKVEVDNAQYDAANLTVYTVCVGY